MIKNHTYKIEELEQRLKGKNEKHNHKFIKKEINDIGMTNDTKGSVTPSAPSPITLRSTYFRAGGNPTLGLSAWGTEIHPTVFPENARSTIFWGDFYRTHIEKCELKPGHIFSILCC